MGCKQYVSRVASVRFRNEISLGAINHNVVVSYSSISVDLTSSSLWEKQWLSIMSNYRLCSIHTPLLLIPSFWGSPVCIPITVNLKRKKVRLALTFSQESTFVWTSVLLSFSAITMMFVATALWMAEGYHWQVQKVQCKHILGPHWHTINHKYISFGSLLPFFASKK